MGLWYYQFSKLAPEGKMQYGYGPVLLLFAVLGLSNGLGGSQTMANHMLPHILCAVADIPTIRHSAEHCYAEMKPDMIVECLVVLRGVHAQQTVPSVHLLLEYLTPIYDLPILLDTVH